ncbi:C-type lectin domain family 4 member A-like [Ochlerotatus camptorhynchus]|uniref:C-type lectin domain family 4 member A-like n=1 Tax=Ochlerotatus camptorhynchus TaxID=644619 RepID=UPI0031E3739C
MGSRLAIVDSEEKHNTVVRQAKAAELHSSGYFGGWLDATDLARAKSFVWHSTGARVQFSRWRIGEPSGGNEHCGALQYWPLLGFVWTWNDVSCNKQLYAICESTDRGSCV